jgi:hypothetical protein
MRNADPTRRLINRILYALGLVVAFLLIAVRLV